MYFEVLNSPKIRKCIFRHLNYYVWWVIWRWFNLISLQTKKLQIWFPPKFRNHRNFAKFRETFRSVSVKRFAKFRIISEVSEAYIFPKFRSISAISVVSEISDRPKFRSFRSFSKNSKNWSQLPAIFHVENQSANERVEL